MKTGIHIRLTTNLSDIIKKAIRIGAPFFQTFFIYQSGKYIKLDSSDVKNFLYLRQDFSDIYAHGSYWINLCQPDNISYKILEKEALLAKKLEFSHLILHPGSASGCKDKLEGIENLAKRLNNFLKKESNISIVLENTAHGNLSIGGDLNDFQILLSKIDKPDKISFCIDTAHAYSFGYNISNDMAQDDFISLIEKIIGKDKVALIHLNDTQELLGKKIDKHVTPGEGLIGRDALGRFLKHEYFIDVPALIEFPNLCEEEEIKLYNDIKKWRL